MVKQNKPLLWVSEDAAAPPAGEAVWTPIHFTLTNTLSENLFCILNIFISLRYRTEYLCKKHILRPGVTASSPDMSKRLRSRYLTSPAVSAFFCLRLLTGKDGNM